MRLAINFKSWRSQGKGVFVSKQQNVTKVFWQKKRRGMYFLKALRHQNTCCVLFNDLTLNYTVTSVAWKNLVKDDGNWAMGVWSLGSLEVIFQPSWGGKKLWIHPGWGDMNLPYAVDSYLLTSGESTCPDSFPWLKRFEKMWGHMSFYMPKPRIFRWVVTP